MDTSQPGTGGHGTLDRQHQYFYTAAWQIAEELIDRSWSPIGPSNPQQTIEYVWGVRYIDDIILRRSADPTILNPDGPDGNYTHYHLTDHQFSTVALIDNAARLSRTSVVMAEHRSAMPITGTQLKVARRLKAVVITTHE